MTLWLFFADQETISRFHLHPLGKYMDEYAKWLHDSGYSRSTARYKIRIVARWSPWLKRNGISAQDLNQDHLSRYLTMKVRKSPLFNELDISTLKQYLKFLQDNGVTSQNIQIETTPTERTISEFVLYLKNERALSLGTIAQYKRHVARFLNDRFSGCLVEFASIFAPDITRYIQKAAAKMSKKDAKLLCTALRAFFRYARAEGLVDTQLDAAIPTVPNWRMASLPKSVSLENLQKILSSCDQRKAAGKRDYAIILLLARLGLRAGEVARLRLDDIDWHAGVVCVHGKGSDLSQMPLPQDVGEAIAAYLQDGRPKCSSRRIFVRLKAPIREFRTSAAICCIVRAAIKRAAIDCPRTGSHQFRHSLATSLLRGRTSLQEIAELLRHRTLDCTTIYAKVDLLSLKTLAQPWPGGFQ